MSAPARTSLCHFGVICIEAFGKRLLYHDWVDWYARTWEAIIAAIDRIGIGTLLNWINCFAAGTQVVLDARHADDGTVHYVTKAIETIREGDFVLARDDDGRVVQQRVVRTMAGFCDHLRLVTLVDGDGRSQTLRTTDEHPFWSATIQDWICAGDLEPGMLCEGPNGERLTVESTARQENPLGVPVYNFEVENAHTYFVQETPESPAPLLVHNAKKTVANPCAPQDPTKNADDIAFGLTRAQREALVAHRPERYRRGVVDKVWENAKGPNGKVIDPNTLEELSWDRSKFRDGQWDMGHLPGKSYDQLKQRFLDGEISRKQFLDEYNNPANYRPEGRSPNRSRRYE